MGDDFRIIQQAVGILIDIQVDEEDAGVSQLLALADYTGVRFADIAALNENVAAGDPFAGFNDSIL